MQPLLLHSVVSTRPLQAQPLASPSGNPGDSLIPAAHQQLAELLVSEMGNSAAPLLEAVIACCPSSKCDVAQQSTHATPLSDIEDHASQLLSKCPGRLLLRLRNFASSASWITSHAISNRALEKYRVFAGRVRDEAGPNHVRQLTLLTTRLFKQEILPLDYALCTTRLLGDHAHLLPPLFRLLSDSRMEKHHAESSFKRALLDDSPRPPASPRKTSAALTCSQSASAAARSSRKLAAMAQFDQYSCEWGAVPHLMPMAAKEQATLSLSHFAIEVHPNSIRSEK